MIIFKTINSARQEVSTTFNNFEEFQKEWNKEEDNMPYIDDKLIYAEISGKQIQGATFKDILKYLIIYRGLKTH